MQVLVEVVAEADHAVQALVAVDQAEVLSVEAEAHQADLLVVQVLVEAEVLQVAVHRVDLIRHHLLQVRVQALVEADQAILQLQS
jgi:hypothetical protein